jgi:hypothetical protein
MKWAIDVSGYDSRRYVFPAGYLYDRPIDWVRARDEGGLSLAIIKSSEGLYVDRAFNMNWSGASGVIARAAYHFFRSNVNAISQADVVLNLLDARGFDPNKDRFVLDYETLDGVTPKVSLKAMASFMYEMQREKITPLLYTYPSFWRSIGGEDAKWAVQYPLYLAQWPRDNWWGIMQTPPYLFTGAKLAALKGDVECGVLAPMALKPWDGAFPAIWQFTARADTKSVPGHPGIKLACDYNAVYMPLDGPVAPPVVSTGSKYRVTAALLKVFAGSSDATKQVTSLTNGAEVIVTTTVMAGYPREEWAHIQNPDGWVRAKWLQKE